MMPTLAGSSSLPLSPRDAAVPGSPRAGSQQPARNPSLVATPTLATTPALVTTPTLVTTWRYHAMAGYTLIFLTFGVIGAWSTVARLDRAVVSPGVINVESSRKVVQHFEG